MADNLDNEEDLDDDVDGANDSFSEHGIAASVSDKKQAQMSLEARRRLELKLEEVRVNKQMQDYEFDDDFD